MTRASEPGRYLAVVAGLGVLVVAVVARFVTTSPLWLDEALSVHIADLPVGDIGEALRHDGHPPLYYWLLHAWMAVVGDGDVAVRALSGIAGVAALPLMWLSGRRVGGTRTAWAALLLLALSPFAVRYSTETRMYALLSVLVLAGHLLVRRAVDEMRAPWPWLVGVAALSGALLLTHYWSAFLLVAVVAVLAWWGRRRGSPARPVAARLVLGVVAGGLFFLPWVPAFLEQAEHTGTPWATAPRPTVVADQTLREFGGGTIAEAGLLAALLVVLVLLGVAGRSTPAGLVLGHAPMPGVHGEAWTAGLTLAFGAAVGLLTANTYAARYASVVLPLVLLVAARGLAVVPGRRAPWLVAGLLVVLSGAGIVDNVIGDRTQAGVLVDAIDEQANAGDADVVVTCPDQLGPAMRRRLDQEGLASIPVLAYPTLGDGRRVDWQDYEERNDATDPAAVAEQIVDRAGDGRIWVAWSGSYRTFEGDCEALLNALSTMRGPFRALVAEESAGEFFEHAALVVFE